MYRMFVRPEGDDGEAGASLMARTGRPLATAAVDLLRLPPTASAVVEIGFGPGLAIEELLRVVPDAHVTGVDPSTVMHRHAAERNAAAIAAHRVTLLVGEAAEIPVDDATQDAALVLDNLHFWPDPHAWLDIELDFKV